MIREFETNLRCGSCVATLAPVLDGDPDIRRWSVDISDPGKRLTVEGDGVTTDHVRSLVASAGYQVLGEVEPHAKPAPAAEGPKQSYYPLALILAYLAGAVGLAEWALGGFDPMRAMAHFMAGFFLVFSFFKLLDLRAFADSYATYDVLAARSRAYALAYPFLELGLGAAYLAGRWPAATNWVTLAVMTVGAVGVVRGLLSGRKIRCACLGAVFNLPMSYVTLAEDVLMAGMALAMLFAMG